MAKPNPLCELKHGDIITKQNYPTFVETFNSTVDRCANLRGDGDFDPDQGKVTVDNTDYNHPVIRLTQSFLSSIGKGGGDERVKVDSELLVEDPLDGLSSLEYKYNEDLSSNLYQLYNFDNATQEGVLLSSAQFPATSDERIFEVPVRDRGQDGYGPAVLKWMNLGRIVSGNDSNVVISGNGGGLTINVYYI